jgi:hypothetical protein
VSRAGVRDAARRVPRAAPGQRATLGATPRWGAEPGLRRGPHHTEGCVGGRAARAGESGADVPRGQGRGGAAPPREQGWVGPRRRTSRGAGPRRHVGRGGSRGARKGRREGTRRGREQEGEGEREEKGGEGSSPRDPTLEITVSKT